MPVPKELPPEKDAGPALNRNGVRGAEGDRVHRLDKHFRLVVSSKCRALERIFHERIPPSGFVRNIYYGRKYTCRHGGEILMDGSSCPIDWTQAELQARHIGGSTIVTVQTFPDNPADRADEQRRRQLTRVLHGDLSDPHFRARLQRLHNDGAGLFITVNRTDGKGRKTGNIVAVLAAIIDGDLKKPGVAATCAAFLAGSGLEPSLDIESSEGNHHYYFLLCDCALPEYKYVQHTLYSRAGTDLMHDLPRVLRMAGAWHRKGAPFQSHIVSMKDVVYTMADVRERAERVAPVTSQAAPRAATPTAGTGRTGVLEATQRLRVLFDENKGLLKPAIRELVRQVGIEKCGRHNAIVAIAGRLVFQKWTDAQAAEFLVPIVNNSFSDNDDDDWTVEVQAAMSHARRRGDQRLNTVRKVVWP